MNYVCVHCKAPCEPLPEDYGLLRHPPSTRCWFHDSVVKLDDVEQPTQVCVDNPMSRDSIALEVLKAIAGNAKAWEQVDITPPYRTPINWDVRMVRWSFLLADEFCKQREVTS